MKKSTIKNRGVLLTALVLSTFAPPSRAFADLEGSSVSQEVRICVQEIAMIASTGPGILRLDVDGDREGSVVLQYTTVNAHDACRRILVSWHADERAPAGTSLRLRAVSVPAGGGRARSEVVVSAQPACLIDRIPSFTTGRGSCGALLAYRLCIDDASRLADRQTTIVTLVFTIIDDT